MENVVRLNPVQISKDETIDTDLFKRIEEAVIEAGFEWDIELSKSLSFPENAEIFASRAILVILSSGFKFVTAHKYHNLCMTALRKGDSAASVFKHKGKTKAIDQVWQEKINLFQVFNEAEDKLAFCGSLPFVGKVTKYHLAKDCGVPVAKPDVHLQRIADHQKCTVDVLCQRLSHSTGHSVPTIDTILWRACEAGLVKLSS